MNIDPTTTLCEAMASGAFTFSLVDGILPFSFYLFTVLAT